MKRALILAGLLVTASSLAGRGPAAGQALRADGPPVRSWEAPLTLPSYTLGPAEPNPMFYAGRNYQGARGRIYPYPLVDQLGETPEDRAWRALWLENEYVRLSVLPELGGRIFSAEDKTNGYPFFYRQHVIKPALVGMIGAWISGGVEWNVMHHHRPSSLLPVQSASVENADGSRTIWVGETEWRQRMRWVVGITLRPGSSVVEAEVRMLNRTPLPHSVLYFANPAVHANEEYEVLFPPDVSWTTFHSKGEFAPWPLARGPFVGIPYAPGTHLGFFKNHPRPISFFAYDSELDFFGGYDHGRRAGVVHVADRDTVPGKKFWTWGNGPDGREWDRILTDEDGPYIELMTGGYSDNQPDYSWLEPGEEKALRQHWYPSRELGGLRAANTEAALDLAVGGGRVHVAVNATARHEGARVRLVGGTEVVFEETLTLAPDRPFVREVPLPSGLEEEDLRLSVGAADGSLILSYQPRPRPLTPQPAPYQPPPAPARVASVEELVLAGQRLEQFHNPTLEPEPYYREALRREPGDARAHTALGRLALRRGLHDDAERQLSRAVARLTANHTRARDGEPQYLLGLALRARGRADAARGAFAAAAWDPGWSGPALLEQARLESARGNSAAALDLGARAVDASPRSTAALVLHAALLRHSGRLEEACAEASRALAIDPLDPLAARERQLVRAAGACAGDAALDGLAGAAVQALREDAYALEAAHDYARAGLLADATAVLEPRLPRSQPAAKADPLVAYTLAWLLEQQGDHAGARAYSRRGRELPSDYCFPFRLESVPVLERAMAADPTDPRAPYYLGNLLYDVQPERAIDEWEKARALDPSFARVHRNLAFAYARVREDLGQATLSQRRAIAIEKGEPRFYYELDQYLGWAGSPLAERLRALSESPATVAGRDMTRSRLARVQLLLGRPDEALASLGVGRFHVWEGERGIAEVYVAARLERGRRKLAARDAAAALAEFEAALEIPPNIEVGQAVGSHLPVVHHHIGLAKEALGRTAEARAAFRASAEAATLLPDSHYWVGRSLERLGRQAEARPHFERLAGARPPLVDTSRPFEVRMASRAAGADAQYQRALGLLGLGRVAEARKALAAAREADPDNVGAHGLWLSLARTPPGQPQRRAARSRVEAVRPQVEAAQRPRVEAPPEEH